MKSSLPCPRSQLWGSTCAQRRCPVHTSASPTSRRRPRVSGDKSLYPCFSLMCVASKAGRLYDCSCGEKCWRCWEIHNNELRGFDTLLLRNLSCVVLFSLRFHHSLPLLFHQTYFTCFLCFSKPQQGYPKHPKCIC